MERNRKWKEVDTGREVRKEGGQKEILKREDRGGETKRKEEEERGRKTKVKEEWRGIENGKK